MRVTDEFLKSVENDKDWQLIARLSGKPHKTLKARDLWDQIGHAAWASADPGIQFHTTINDWHTCPKSGTDPRVQPVLGVHVPRRHGLQSGVAEPHAVPPARTARFDTNLRARLPLVDGRARDLGADGAVPSRQIAELSYRYRTLGLGFANIGGLLMASGIPYDSQAGRAICGAISAIMTGVSYATSAEMARELGPFPGYHAQRRRHAARHPQPPARRLRPGRRLREARHQPGAARPRGLPRRR